MTNIFYKIIIIGDGGIGKTCTVQRYTERKCNENYVATVGVDFAIKRFDANNKTIKVQIWDTAGQEKFRSIVRLYYRGAHGIVIMYDLTNKESFIHVKDWLKDIRLYADANVPIVLVGNKCDEEDNRQIDDDDCAVLLKENPEILSSWEISAQMNINVSAPFKFLVTLLLDKSENEIGSQFNLNATKKRSCCH